MPANRTFNRSFVSLACLAAAILTAPAASAIDFVLTPADSIQNALNIAGPGDRIVLQPGVYAQTFSLASTGKKLTIMSSQPREAVIQPTGNRAFMITSNGQPVTFTGVVFRGGSLAGSASLNQGAAGFITGSDVRFNNCAFESNVAAVSVNVTGATSRGGALYAIASSIDCTDCSFTGNLARVKTVSGNTGERFAEGGAIHAAGSTVALTRCDFTGNIARVEHQANDVRGSVYGGALRTIDCTTSITSCVFSGNIARTVGSDGVTRAYGGAIVVSGAAGDLSLHNSLLANNLAEADTVGIGAGLLVDVGAFAHVLSCTVTDNAASHAGGGLYSLQATLECASSVVIGNTGIDGVATNLYGPVTSLGFNLRGPSSGATIGGNPNADLVDLDPMFANPAAGDYSLASGSPCIDHGNALRIVEAGILNDLAGAFRAVDDPDTANGFGWWPTVTGPAVVDIGAYEFQPAPVVDSCPSDLDGDGQVGAGDLASMLGSWGVCP